MLETAIKFLVIVLICYFIFRRESFANKTDKAKKYYDWFSHQKTPTYTSYRDEFNQDANIVEYEAVNKLWHNGPFNVGQIIQVI